MWEFVLGLGLFVYPFWQVSSPGRRSLLFKWRVWKFPPEANVAIDMAFILAGVVVVAHWAFGTIFP